MTRPKGLFETIRIRGGRTPLLAEHLARLGAGLWRLDLADAPPGLEHRLRQFEAEGDLVLRVTIDAAGERIETGPVLPAEPLRVALTTVPHLRYEVKSTERQAFDRAVAAARASGADEALLLTRDGYLAEGSLTTLFFWSDELLCTPDLSLGILPGIGRARVLKLAREMDIPVASGRFVPAALEGASIFLTNAARGVIEVAALDGRPVPRDPRTDALAARFWG